MVFMEAGVACQPTHSFMTEKKPPVGLEPATCGLQNRCSAN